MQKLDQIAHMNMSQAIDDRRFKFTRSNEKINILKMLFFAKYQICKLIFLRFSSSWSYSTKFSQNWNAGANFDRLPELVKPKLP